MQVDINAVFIIGVGLLFILFLILLIVAIGNIRKKEDHKPKKVIELGFKSYGGFKRPFVFFERVQDKKGELFELFRRHNYNSKIDSLSIPSVENVEYSKNDLIRPTNYKCPDCRGSLYNSEADGFHFYCKNCKYLYKGHYLKK